MGIIQERISQVEQAMQEVKNHPMCLRFRDDGQAYTVIYPPGDFPTDGVRCRYGILHSKTEALRRILDRMERHWVESYPSIMVV